MYLLLYFPIVILYISITLNVEAADICTLLSLKGGLVPEAREVGGDYYEQFRLDYGTDDKERIAGSLRGFIKSGNIASLPETDPFLKWINVHLENGQEQQSGRIKPFYAADFGSRKDLKNRENPKVIIVQHKLKYDKNGYLLPASKEIDVEIREIWQPWLKRKCDFVVRYIVPNRVNIINILESKKLFSSKVEIITQPDNKQAVVNTLTFRPNLVSRLFGKRNVVLKRNIGESVLIGSKAASKAFKLKSPLNNDK